MAKATNLLQQNLENKKKGRPESLLLEEVEEEMDLSSFAG